MAGHIRICSLLFIFGIKLVSAVILLDTVNPVTVLKNACCCLVLFPQISAFALLIPQHIWLGSLGTCEKLPDSAHL